MADPDPISQIFNVKNGLCNQGGRVALDASAPVKVQENFIIDGLTGGAEAQRAATQALPSCRNPVQVSNVPYKGPGGR